ncbi:MAG: HAD family hydrolase [Chryseobacterium sp.]|uniref:HAD family hydrolase n=1 Tax=Epilithonimonas caeni TaxID=365343 RepID=UPI000405E138|nr:HAD family hydrolase [Epilithonimonas caeni]MPS74328.1 HAD family hydrolase [Chryseobacterium sp.]
MRERDSIIFDLDGTLWNASETVVKAFNDSIQEIGFDINITSKAVRDFSGMKMDDIFAQHFSFIPKDKLQKFEKIYAKKENEYLKNYGGELFPNVKETLERLTENYRLFIVSNCMKGYIENFIGFFSFNDLFEDFECFGNDGLPKDKNITLIVERNNLQNPVYVGDTIWDKESSEKAGVDFIYATYGFGKIENPKVQIQNFEDLLSMKL